MFVVDSATQLHFQVRVVLEFQFGVCCSCAPQEASTASLCYVVCCKVTLGVKGAGALQATSNISKAENMIYSYYFILYFMLGSMRKIDENKVPVREKGELQLIFLGMVH